MTMLRVLATMTVLAALGAMAGAATAAPLQAGPYARASLDEDVDCLVAVSGPGSASAGMLAASGTGPASGWIALGACDRAAAACLGPA